MSSKSGEASMSCPIDCAEIDSEITHAGPHNLQLSTPNAGIGARECVGFINQNQLALTPRGTAFSALKNQAAPLSLCIALA